MNKHAPLYINSTDERHCLVDSCHEKLTEIVELAAVIEQMHSTQDTSSAVSVRRGTINTRPSAVMILCEVTVFTSIRFDKNAVGYKEPVIIVVPPGLPTGTFEIPLLDSCQARTTGLALWPLH